MSVVMASGQRRGRSRLHSGARSTPPPVWRPATVFVHGDPIKAESLTNFWMSAKTRDRACALRDEPALPRDFRLALAALTDLYRIALHAEDLGE